MVYTSWSHASGTIPWRASRCLRRRVTHLECVAEIRHRRHGGIDEDVTLGDNTHRLTRRVRAIEGLQNKAAYPGLDRCIFVRKERKIKVTRFCPV